jgi:hypothetical protein
MTRLEVAVATGEGPALGNGQEWRLVVFSDARVLRPKA